MHELQFQHHDNCWPVDTNRYSSQHDAARSNVISILRLPEQDSTQKYIRYRINRRNPNASSPSAVLATTQITSHTGQRLRQGLSRLRLAFDKVKRVLGADTVDRTGLVVERYTVALVRNVDDLRPESGADELRSDLVGYGI